MRGYKSLTIFKSGLRDLCGAWVCSESLELEQGWVGARPGLGRNWARPELGWAEVGLRLGRTSTVIYTYNPDLFTVSIFKLETGPYFPDWTVFSRVDHIFQTGL